MTPDDIQEFMLNRMQVFNLYMQLKDVNAYKLPQDGLEPAQLYALNKDIAITVFYLLNWLHHHANATLVRTEMLKLCQAGWAIDLIDNVEYALYGNTGDVIE